MAPNQGMGSPPRGRPRLHLDGFSMTRPQLLQRLADALRASQLTSALASRPALPSQVTAGTVHSAAMIGAAEKGE